MKSAMMVTLLLIACSDPQPNSEEIANESPAANTSIRIKDTQAAVRGVFLDMPDTSVYRIWGQADSLSLPAYSEIIGDSVITAYYPHGSVSFYGHKLQELACSARSCVTADQVAVGDHISKVFHSYGKQPLQTSDSLTWVRYGIATLDCWLDFVIVSNVVSGIRMECDWS